MAIPTYDQFIEPLLRFLSSRPDGAETSEAYTALADAVGLTAEERDDRLADDVLNPIIATQSAGLGTCLQAAPVRTAQIKFWIRGKDGRVTRVEVNGKQSDQLSNCVRKVMMNLRFPSCRAKTTAAQFEIGS